MDRPLDIEGDFLLEFEGGEARLEIRDEVVDLHFPDAQSALAAMRQVSPSTRREALRRADAQLRAVGLIGHVRVRGQSIAQLGGTVRASLIARMLKVDPLALKLFTFLGVWLGRKRSIDAHPASDQPRDRSSQVDHRDSSTDGGSS